MTWYTDEKLDGQDKAFLDWFKVLAVKIEELLMKEMIVTVHRAFELDIVALQTMLYVVE